MGIDFYIGLCKPDEKREITVKQAFADIVFEEKAVYVGKKKILYTFDESLLALRERGYERHPRPAEAFELIYNGLEGRLSPEQKAIADDMTSYNYGEWLSIAVLQKGNLLHCYLDPENLKWDEKAWKYVTHEGKLKHAGEEVYSIGSLCGCVSIKDVNEINPALVEKLWSRHYAILSEEVKQNAWIWLPSENVLWPVSRGDYNKFFILPYINHWASRGVRQK